MDPRIRNHAETVVDHSTEVEAGDDVVVSAPSVAEDLTLALCEEIAERGANPFHVSFRMDRTRAAFLGAADPEELELPEHELALAEAADVWIHVRAHDNVAEMSGVPSETMSTFRKVSQPVREEILDSRWVLTQYPAPADAQNAEMSTDEYEEFVWSAIDKDWAAQRDHQQQMVEILDAGEEVHIVSGDTTDLRMSVAGMTTINDDAGNNLPGGEVFTAPVADSVEGEVLFDKPLVHQGHEVEDAYLRFEGGEVVDHSATKNEDVLTEVLNTDEGARRLGELGIGMNRDIDRFTYNMLFDEKMGDTVHLAVGMAYEACLPEGETGNESAVHVDMIVDMSEDSFIEVDGEIVQRNGTFRFEE
ncbi:aminopeptidase [Halorussus halobius]|uniref:aminopeptidase n=1 Tax=Halorussus halobius TaxID=1710537 RepID=UPI001092B522|nr:aminopeptidase [Halorussus halobius]